MKRRKNLTKKYEPNVKKNKLEGGKTNIDCLVVRSSILSMVQTSTTPPALWFITPTKAAPIKLTKQWFALPRTDWLFLHVSFHPLTAHLLEYALQLPCLGSLEWLKEKPQEMTKYLTLSQVLRFYNDKEIQCPWPHLWGPPTLCIYRSPNPKVAHSPTDGQTATNPPF